jgi:hypothetical protein
MIDQEQGFIIFEIKMTCYYDIRSVYQLCEFKSQWEGGRVGY